MGLKSHHKWSCNVLRRLVTDRWSLREKYKYTLVQCPFKVSITARQVTASRPCPCMEPHDLCREHYKLLEAHKKVRCTLHRLDVFLPCSLTLGYNSHLSIISVPLNLIKFRASLSQWSSFMKATGSLRFFELPGLAILRFWFFSENQN